MADNLFSAVLTFSLLAAGTIAVGSEMVAPRQAGQASAVAMLPTVVVTGHRPVVTASAIDTGRTARVE